MGAKPKDAPKYSIEEEMNSSSSLGLSDIRARNLRKAEASKKQMEAKMQLQNVSAPPAMPVKVVQKEEESKPQSVEPAVKKKKYSIYVTQEAVKSEIKEEAGVEADPTLVVDPAEFAKQERLRKQKEKQARFQTEAGKRKVQELEPAHNQGRIADLFTFYTS